MADYIDRLMARNAQTTVDQVTADQAEAEKLNPTPTPPLTGGDVGNWRANGAGWVLKKTLEGLKTIPGFVSSFDWVSTPGHAITDGLIALADDASLFQRKILKVTSPEAPLDGSAPSSTNPLAPDYAANSGANKIRTAAVDAVAGVVKAGARGLQEKAPFLFGTPTSVFGKAAEGLLNMGVQLMVLKKMGIDVAPGPLAKGVEPRLQLAHYAKTGGNFALFDHLTSNPDRGALEQSLRDETLKACQESPVAGVLCKTILTSNDVDDAVLDAKLNAALVSFGLTAVVPAVFNAKKIFLAMREDMGGPVSEAEFAKLFSMHSVSPTMAAPTPSALTPDAYAQKIADTHTANGGSSIHPSGKDLYGSGYAVSGVSLEKQFATNPTKDELRAYLTQPDVAAHLQANPNDYVSGGPKELDRERGVLSEALRGSRYAASRWGSRAK